MATGCRSDAPINLHQSQIGFRVSADDFAIVLFAIGQLHFDLIRIFNHVVIGQDVSFFAGHKSRADASLYGRRSRISARKRPKKSPNGCILVKRVFREATRSKATFFIL